VGLPSGAPLPAWPVRCALFENWLAWIARIDRPGGCVILAASVELRRPSGQVRDALVAGNASFAGACQGGPPRHR